MNKLLPHVYLSTVGLLITAGLSFAQTEVSVQLHSCRSEFRPHDSTDKPGFGVKFELTPAADVTMIETEHLGSTITLTDDKGSKYTPSTARLYTEDGKTYAKFTYKKRPSGSKIKLSGELDISLAKNVAKHSNIKADALAPTSVQINGSTFNITPAAANADKGNKEGERLRRAEISLQYPANITIMQIARQWGPESADAFVQEIDFSTTVSQDNTTKTTTFVLVDALPAPLLEISTCTETKGIKLPVNFDVTLSGVTTPPAAQENVSQ